MSPLTTPPSEHETVVRAGSVAPRGRRTVVAWATALLAAAGVGGVPPSGAAVGGRRHGGVVRQLPDRVPGGRALVHDPGVGPVVVAGGPGLTLRTDDPAKLQAWLKDQLGPASPVPPVPEGFRVVGGARADVAGRPAAGAWTGLALGDEPAVDQLADALGDDRPRQPGPDDELGARPRPAEPDLIEDRDQRVERLLGERAAFRSAMRIRL